MNPAPNPVLDLVGARKRRGSRDLFADLTLTVNAGELVVLRGANGVGKSTLLAAIAGLVPFDRGAVRVAGRDLDRERRACLLNVGYAPERADLPEHLLTVEWLDIAASLRGLGGLTGGDRARFGIAALAEKRLGALSLGQQRRVLVAAAMLGAPPLLIFDEPTNGLDDAGVAELGQTLAEHARNGGAVLVATHDDEGALPATRTLRLADGKLVLTNDADVAARAFCASAKRSPMTSRSFFKS